MKRAKFAKQKVEIFKPALDTRYSEEDVVSHDQNSIRSTPIGLCGLMLLLATTIWSVVGIDEAQFTDNGLVEVCNELANRGVRVIVAGLDMDFKSSLRSDSCSLCHRRRGDQGSCHLRKVRIGRLCRPPVDQ